jgi:glyoxylase-like metal-dependent hydrolase (beta-lactamase superfamily II)
MTASVAPPPRPLPDAGVGPAVVTTGEAVEVAAGVLRLTAANPSQMTGPGTNTYLVGSERLAVIDPGPDLAEHLDAIERVVSMRGAAIGWILVTHHHPDHAPGAAVLAERTGAPLVAYGHEQGVHPDVAARDGFEVAGPGFVLRALHTPGHASDHLCWLLEGERLLFSGDHVMHGSTVVIKPPDANMADYLATLRRLADIDPPVRAIAPGHGRLIGDPRAAISAIVAHRLEREAQVAAVLSAHGGPAGLDDLLPLVYGDVAESLLPVARGSLWAHLQKLAADGRARVVGEETDPLASTESSRWAPLRS